MWKPNTVSTVEKVSNNWLVCVAGPTASGKTSLAIDLAQHFDTEIISYDSRQFYRELKIGAAPPSAEELAQVPHHFIQDRSIEQELSAGAFAEEALVKLEALFKKHSVVVAVGGSGLYLRALLEGFDDLPSVPNEIRQELNALFQAEGIETLQKELFRKDPQYFQEVDRQNPQRLIRALELIRHSGKTYSELRTGNKAERPFHNLQIALDWERAKLYERINQRVDLMIEAGLIDEVEGLIPYQHLNALQTVGYRELFPYFEGILSLDEAIAEIKKNSRRYAKRQITWFRRDPNLHWFRPAENATITAWIESHVKAF